MTADRFRILVADDEDGILEGYSSVLGSSDDESEVAERLATLDSELFGATTADDDEADFELTLCHQGEEAVAAVRDAVEAGEPFSVAFLDIRMPPGLDGVQAAERIRELDPNVNIVIVTGYADVQAGEIAKRVRPADKFLYCQKPVQAAELEQFANALTAKWAAEKALVTAKELAEHADLAKSNFLANMSHELRTPLNAVIGFSEMIKSETLGPMGNDRYRGYVDDIHDCGTHLLAVINDILDLTKVEVGHYELQEERIDMRELVFDAVRLVERQINQAGHEFRANIPDDLPAMMADGRALKQMVLNLMSNAIKFTPRGGRITLAACTCDGGVRLSVKDTGVGMPADKVPLALKPFSQLESGLDRTYEGTGLGLSLTAAMVKLHDGEMRIDSQAEKGTLVTIDFPAERVVGAESPERCMAGLKSAR